jgi:hypothetical protein
MEMLILHSILNIIFTLETFVHAIDELIGRKFVDDKSFVHLRELGNCTWMEPVEGIAFVGTIVKIILPVLLTMFGLKVIEQLRN